MSELIKILRPMGLVATFVGALALAACEDKGTAEKAGEAIDDAVEKTGEAVDDAVEKVTE